MNKKDYKDFYSLRPEYIKSGFSLAMEAGDGFSFIKGNLVVIVSISKEQDGKEWLHLSLSRPNKYPPYDEVRQVKDIFIGNDRKVIWILPEDSEHVNLHPYCFHLWYCFDGDGLPDFTRGLNTL